MFIQGATFIPDSRVLFYNPIKQCVSMQGRQQQWWCTGDRTFMVVLACIVSYSTLFYTQQHPNGYCVNISILLLTIHNDSVHCRLPSEHYDLYSRNLNF